MQIDPNYEQKVEMLTKPGQKTLFGNWDEVYKLKNILPEISYF